MKTLFKRKDTVRVIKNQTSHGFEVGTIVVVKQVNPIKHKMEKVINHYLIADEKGEEAHALESELETVKK